MEKYAKILGSTGGRRGWVMLGHIVLEAHSEEVLLE